MEEHYNELYDILNSIDHRMYNELDSCIYDEDVNHVLHENIWNPIMQEIEYDFDEVLKDNLIIVAD